MAGDAPNPTLQPPPGTTGEAVRVPLSQPLPTAAAPSPLGFSFPVPIDAIKIRTSIPGGFVVAGLPFSLTTTVTNPHPQAIQIHYYLYHIPYQVIWINDVQYNQAHEVWRTKNVFSRLFMPSIWKLAASAPGQVMWYGAAPSGPDAMGIQTILSGESQSYTFKALLPNWLFATGGTLTFQGQVLYSLNGVHHSSVFEVTFPFRPPLMSTCAGSIVGSILGIAAKTIQAGGIAAENKTLSQIIMATILTSILSLIAVAYTSRRSNDVQPVLTVEDFTGGAILGFLIGYMGQQVFEKFVPIK